MFDVDEFVDACRQAAGESGTTAWRCDDVAQAGSQHTRRRGRGAAIRGGRITLLHHSPELTVLNVVWAPQMELYPHDHRMWAAIGIYEGIEDNAFFRRPAPTRGRSPSQAASNCTSGDTSCSATTRSTASPTRADS